MNGALGSGVSGSGLGRVEVASSGSATGGSVPGLGGFFLNRFLNMWLRHGRMVIVAGLSGEAAVMTSLPFATSYAHLPHSTW